VFKILFMPSGVAYPQITFLIQEMAILCYPIIKKLGEAMFLKSLVTHHTQNKQLEQKNA